MISPYFCWSARSFNLNTGGINSESLKSSAMMALPQETILRIAWPHRLFSAKKSTILRKISYSGPGHRECVTGFRAGVCKSSDETRSVDTLATPLKDLQQQQKKYEQSPVLWRKDVKHIHNIFLPNSLKKTQGFVAKYQVTQRFTLRFYNYQGKEKGCTGVSINLSSSCLYKA